jgi:small multidrug resistance family-3 protein
MKAIGIFGITAICEIAGCYAVFGWLRLGKSAWWLVPGALSLAAFAWLLTLHPFQNAGRVYAAYGGVYIAASLLWLWMAERAEDPIASRHETGSAASCFSMCG